MFYKYEKNVLPSLSHYYGISTGDLQFRDPAAPSHQFVIGLSLTTDHTKDFSLVLSFTFILFMLNKYQ